MRDLLNKLSAVKNTLIEFLFPSICIVCNQDIKSYAFGICDKCFKLLETLENHPHCYCCGHKSKTNSLCIACQLLGASFDDVKSAFLYNHLAQKIIRSLKFSDATLIAKFAAHILSNHFEAQIKEADFIIPVPIHRLRLFRRKYNQSALIANHINKIVGIPVKTNIIKKIKHTKPQARLSFCQRKVNMQNAFAIKNSQVIKNKKIILLDDVITTGTTVSLCANLVKIYNPQKITVMSFARSIL